MVIFVLLAIYQNRCAPLNFLSPVRQWHFGDNRYILLPQHSKLQDLFTIGFNGKMCKRSNTFLRHCTAIACIGSISYKYNVHSMTILLGYSVPNLIYVGPLEYCTLISFCSSREILCTFDLQSHSSVCIICVSLLSKFLAMYYRRACLFFLS